MSNNPYKAYQGSSYGSTLEEYIKNTVFIKEQLAVKQFIQYFLWKLESKSECINEEEVSNVLYFILNNEKLLKKIQIVSMISWRNNVVSVFPNMISYDTKYKTVLEALNYYCVHCEVIFLYLNENIINSFQNASVGICKESENLRYFYQLRENWQKEYEILKKNKIDIILDEYNQLQEKYAHSGDNSYLALANNMLKEMRLL